MMEYGKTLGFTLGEDRLVVAEVRAELVGGIGADYVGPAELAIVRGLFAGSTEVGVERIGQGGLRAVIDAGAEVELVVLRLVPIDPEGQDPFRSRAGPASPGSARSSCWR